MMVELHKWLLDERSSFWVHIASIPLMIDTRRYVIAQFENKAKDDHEGTKGFASAVPWEIQLGFASCLPHPPSYGLGLIAGLLQIQSLSPQGDGEGQIITLSPIGCL